MRSAQAMRWCLVVPATMALGALFAYLKVPAGWIVAAIVASASCALITQEELRVHRGVSRVGRSMIAILASAPIIASDPWELVHFVLPGLVVSVITIGIGFAGGLLLARASESTSQETGILSMLAGGASVMPVLAQEVGADFRYVTLTQYLRLLCVTLSLPLLVPMMDVPHGGVVHPHIAHSVRGFICIALIVALGEPLGKLIRLPAPTILGPMALTITVAQFFPDPTVLALPSSLKVVAFVSIGWSAGGALSMQALKDFARQLPATFTFIGVLLGTCALVAWPLRHWLHTSYFEAYLATSPGGLETVLALADEFGAGPSVAAIQVLRLIAILLIAGYLPRIVRLITRISGTPSQ
ncbi:AbrB family transcriptional regulator [Staphylococcus chromogenes]|nr:AbrB family transcriptional regulator [Staphylococcus chromogenes]